MAEDPQELEPTELVDIGDIEASFEDETERRSGRSEPEPVSNITGGLSDEPSGVASLKERFAALFIDSAFLYVIYFVLLLVYRYIVFDNPMGPIPAGGLNGIVFHGIFLLLALIWFAIPEMVFCASVGKLFCRLRIQAVDKEYPSFFSVLIRNIMKPVDIILFPILVTAGLMEWSGLHRRLGDIIAKTIVVKNLGTPPRLYDLSLDMIARATARATAFIIDLALLALFGTGVALLLNPDAPVVSMIILLLSPLLLVAFFTLPEWLTKTSPGKWIWGFYVCMENGSAIDLPSALTRTIWRAIDTNFIGFLTCLFSVRRQRPGDTAAGTVVIKAGRKWQGFAGFICVLLISIATLYAGFGNRESFLSSDFRINFLPSVDFAGRGAAHAGIASLAIRNFNFAADDPETVRRPPRFEAGETVFMIFEVDGYKKDRKNVWLQEDLVIRYPDNKVGLKLDSINEFHQASDDGGPIRFENNIVIPENATTGRYGVSITIRDKIARQELTEQRFFYINPPVIRPDFTEKPADKPEKDEMTPPPPLPPPPMEDADDAVKPREPPPPPKNTGLRRPILDEDDDEDDE